MDIFSKITRSYWLISGVALTITVIWLGHNLTASINSPEALDARKAELTSQLLAVFEEEKRLVQDSPDLKSNLEINLLAPNLPSPLEREANNPLVAGFQQSSNQTLRKYSPQERKQKTLHSSETAQDPRTSFENLLPIGLLNRTNLQFDLNYLLILRLESPAKISIKSESARESALERWVDINIQPGDSLSLIFKRLNLNPQVAVDITRENNAQILHKLRLGPHLKVLVKGTDFISLQYHTDLLSILLVEREGNRYQVSTIDRKFDVTKRTLSGVIESSLLDTGVDSGVSLDVLYKLVLIFQWRIDFNKDLRSGDRYSLIFEERHLDGKHFGSGPILAAEIVVGDATYRAIRHVSQTGDVNYFTPDGESLESFFLRSPMRISRITSRFSKNRYHPILKTWRAHKGVDYGGSAGDPVMATADGMVTLASLNGNYGRTIVIQHGQKYSTLYAHLSRFSETIRVGRPVTQGQVIGYVGSSGLATGPHLHYEFRVNGVHKNPLTIKLPRSFAIDRTARPEFMKTAGLWSKRLDQLVRR